MCIADYIGVSPMELLARDENGQADPEDLRRIDRGYVDYELIVNNAAIGEIVEQLNELNASGLEEAKRLVGLLREVPRLSKEEWIDIRR